MQWILIVFLGQVGNPTLVQVQPPEVMPGMEECLIAAAQINRDFETPKVGACIPAFNEPQGTES